MIFTILGFSAVLAIGIMMIITGTFLYLFLERADEKPENKYILIIPLVGIIILIVSYFNSPIIISIS